MASIQYPATRRDTVIDDFHGEKVADPYRWLEDTDDPETMAWVAAQNLATEQVLSRYAHRTAVRARVQELWDYPKYGVPFERGGRWFQSRNSGLQNQSVVYVGVTVSDEGRVLLDPNTLSPDGTAALTNLTVSPDGSLAAYAVSDSGSDWMTWRVLEVHSGDELSDVIRWSKFSLAAWRHDLSGFYYSALDEPSEGGAYKDESRHLRLFFHRLGHAQIDDEVAFEAPNQPDWLPRAEMSDDDRYLIVTVDEGTGPENMLLIRDLHDGTDGYREISGDFSRKALFVGNEGSRVLLLTDDGAERCKVVATDLERPGEQWADVVPETEDTLLEAQVCGGRLVCHYLRHAHSVLRVFETTGEPVREIPLPGLVSLVTDPLSHGSFEGRPTSDVIYYQVVSFAESGALWSHEIASGVTTLVRPSMSKLAAADFVTEQAFAESDDGTPVPMFLTRRRDVEARSDGRVLLYGYGGFDIPMTPTFSVTFATWLDGGGILAVANLRGGGEYGRAWHDAGRLAHKQNVFDDFCSCARWLAESGWSRPDRIGIAGGSNGGLLVGACITQRPELFGAAVADVGVFDMLRFHKFTIGWAWRSDYGDPDDPEQYRWLRAYSPLHHVSVGTCYPPTLLLTGDHDDRVVPGHSFKFAATLQAAQGCAAPVLLRVATSSGHGQGKPTAKLLDEAADRIVFLDLALGGSFG
jgi:prolyl oligopeptidase